MNALRRISPRSRGGVAAQPACAATAASRAAAPSATVASATDARISPVDGSSTSIVRPSPPARHRPAMNRPVGTRASRDFSISVNAKGIGPFESKWGGVSGVGREGLPENVESLVQQVVPGREGWQETHHVAKRTGRQRDEAMAVAVGVHRAGQGGVGRLVAAPGHELDGQHGPAATDVADDLELLGPVSY